MFVEKLNLALILCAVTEDVLFTNLLSSRISTIVFPFFSFVFYCEYLLPMGGLQSYLNLQIYIVRVVIVYYLTIRIHVDTCGVSVSCEVPVDLEDQSPVVESAIFYFFFFYI